MSTKISIYVKKEYWVTYNSGGLMHALTKKDAPYIYVFIDEMEPVVVEKRKEPYIFELEAGEHYITFVDGNPRKSSNYLGKAVGATVGIGVAVAGAAFGLGAADSIAPGLSAVTASKLHLAAGSAAESAIGSVGALLNKELAKKSKGKKFKNAVVKDNCVGCFLNDGEEIKLSCCKAESDRIMVKVEK